MKVLKAERGSTRLHCLERLLCKRLWTYCKIDCNDVNVVPDILTHKNACTCVCILLSSEEKSFDLDIVDKGFLIPRLTL